MHKAILPILLLLFSATGGTAEIPGHYPEKVLHQGTLNAIDKSRRALVIGDTLIFVGRETSVFRPDGISASFNDFRIDQTLGCNYASEENRLEAQQIWILPAGASFAN